MVQHRLLVSNIERFAIHDGPGIRTAVFLKGCPLSCPWCANPEARKPGRMLMYQAAKCIGCGNCRKTMPDYFIEKEGRCIPRWERIKEPMIVETAVRSCLGNALTINGKWMTSEELFSLVMRDAAYYRDTKGGVTFSGGEPLLHICELVPILERFKSVSVHTAAETCGAVSRTQIEIAAEHFNLFLYDIKTADADRFHSVTGGSLKEVLDNLRYLLKRKTNDVIVRIPVIPGFNHTNRDMKEIFSMIAGMGVKRADLLPFHTLGAEKYRQMGEAYLYEGHSILHKKDLEGYSDLGMSYGLSIKIGG